MPYGQKIEPAAAATWDDDVASDQTSEEWVEPADHRPPALVYDLRDPGCRRRRALAMLALWRLGNPSGDLAVWFGVTPRQVRNVVKQAGEFATALGFSDGHEVPRPPKPFPRSVRPVDRGPPA